MGPPPVVTGVSPKEGPPGTRVTIRGEFLGNKPTDLVGLSICGSDCLLSAEWKSATKIIARSGPGKGRGEIVVTTLSGGQGTCTVQFRGYHEAVGPLKESAVWVEEAVSPLHQGAPWASDSSYYNVDDPLGLSVEANEKKILDEDLSEMFPGGSGDLGNESFSPGWFLLERHQATPFDDLRSGLAFLRRKIQSHKQGHLSFLKGNVGSVMEQLETLETLKSALEKDLSNAGLDRIEEIQKSITDSTTEGESLFEGVLSGREAAERRRSALATMQRFRFLFTLPNGIETNVKAEEYDAVISDYSRALNLFGKTEVNLFKKVLAEVEAKISDLKVLLQKKLHNVPITLDYQKKIIRSLVGLGYEGDPGWEAIKVQADFISSQIVQIAQSTGQGAGKTGVSRSNKEKKNGGKDDEALVNRRVEGIEDMVRLVLTRLPYLRSLAHSYFAGELHIKPDPSKKQLFQALLSEVVGKCVSGVRWASLGNNPSLGPWLPHALRTLRGLHSLSLPPQAQSELDSLLLDLRLECVRSSLGNCIEKVKKLDKEEDWQLIHDSQRGTITRLPLLFEGLVNECCSSLKESVLHGSWREPPLLESCPRAKVEASSLLTLAAQAFTSALQILADEEDDGGGPALATASHLSTYSNLNQQPTMWEGRVLACLANWHWLETEWSQEVEKSWGVGVEVSEAGPLVASLIEAKSDPLVGTIEPSMYIGEFDWSTDLPPTDIRPYAKEIIANLIAVHAQLEEVCPWLEERVLTSIVETVGEEMSRLMSCVPRMSPEGAQQATLDLHALLHALEPFLTDSANSFFMEALDAVRKLKPLEKKLVDALLEKFKARMSMQLSAFGNFTKTPS